MKSAVSDIKQVNNSLIMTKVPIIIYDPLAFDMRERTIIHNRVMDIFIWVGPFLFYLSVIQSF